MKRQASVRPILVLCVLVAAVLATGYVVVTLQGEARERYLIQRYERAVATLVTQVQSVTEARVSVLAQTVRAAARESRLTPEAASATSFRDDVRNALARSFVLEDVRDVPCTLSFERGGYRGGFCANPLFAVQTEDPKGPFAALGEAGRSRVHTEPTLHFCIALPEQGTDDESDVCVRADVGGLLEAYLVGSSLDDIDVALLDETGQVAFARGPRGPRIARWPQEASQAEPSSAALRPTSPRDPSVAAWPSFTTVQSAAQTARAEIGGNALWLVTQPVRISLAPPGELVRLLAPALVRDVSASALPPPAKTWVLAALVPASDLKARSRAVSSWVMATTAFIVLLGLFVTPLLKLWTLGPRDRLRPLDVQLVAASLLAVIGLVIIGLLTIGTHAVLRARADRELADDAARVRQTFFAWLDRGYTELSAFVAARDRAPLAPNLFLECSHVGSGNPSCRTVTPACAVDALACKSGDTTLVAPMPDDALLRNELQLIVLSDAVGNQVEKWSKTVVTEQINMAGFRSFRDVVPTTFGTKNLRALRDGRRFAFNIQASPNTAETLALLSIERQDTAAIAVLGYKRLKRALGSGAEIAIIKADGQVLVHGLDRREIFENFLAECSGCDDLRSAIAANVSGVFDVEYHGRAGRVAVKPVQETGYFALVVESTERLRTATFETFVVAVATYLCLAVALLVVSSTFVGFRERRAGGWIWPRRDAPGTHADTSAALLLLVLVSIGAVGRLEPLPALLATTAAGLVGVALTFLRARTGNARQRFCAITTLILAAVVVVTTAPSGTQVVWWTTLLAVAIVIGSGWAPLRVLMPQRALEPPFLATGLLLLLLTAVLPAVAAFRDAFTGSAGRLVAAARKSAETAPTCDLGPACSMTLWDDEAALDSSDRSGWIDDLVRALFGTTDGWVVAARDVMTSPPLVQEPTWPNLSASIAAWLPYVNEDAIALRRVATENRAPTLASELPGLGGLALLAVIALGIVAGWALLRGIARRIFGIHLSDEPPTSRSSNELAAGELWLDPSAAEIAALVDGKAGFPRASQIDLRSFAAVDDLRRRIGWAASAAEVLVLHLEHHIDERDWNAAKLELLEAVLFGGTAKTRIVVMSEIDVLTYMTERLRSPSDAATDENYLSAADLDRWSTVLNRLAKRASNTRPHGTPLPSPLRGLLVEECRWTSRLLGIEQEILAHPARGATDENDLYRDLADRAWAHYRMLWSACTDEERLVLLHLARDGFVSPKSWRIVRRLFGRRLVRWTPALRLMNESFRRFVETVEDERVVRRWERAGGWSSWRKLQVVLVVSFVVLALFLYATRPDQLTGMVAFLTAIGGGAATLVQLMGFMRTRSEAAGER